MLKFIRGKGQQPSAERQKLQRELFCFRKTVQHGFPNKPTALAWDPVLRLLALGTATGAIKIFGKPGVEFYGQHASHDAAVTRLAFLSNEGRLVSLCDDNSLHLWEVNGDKMEEVKAITLEGKLKRISSMCLESALDHLLLGTEGGNIYLLNVKTFEVSETIIYQDVVMQNVPEDYKINPGAVECIAEQPGSPDKILIGYNRGLMVLWDRKTPGAEQTFISSQQLESVCWHRSGGKFASSHNDGSFAYWDVAVGERPVEEPTTLYGPFPCKAITKFLWRHGKNDDHVLFSGGMPRASFGDRNTVTVQHGERHVVFDFTSKVIDFFTIAAEPDSKEFDAPDSLIVLLEEELIAIDLSGAAWRMMAPPYLVSLHASAVTCSQHVGGVAAQLWRTLVAAGRQQTAHLYAEREWPVNGGTCLSAPPPPHDGGGDGEADEGRRELLLTGHEDGTVRFWDAGGVTLRPLLKFSSAQLFSGDEIAGEGAGEREGEEEEEWPPFVKVGTFDPYSDDPRLAVKKVALCPHSGTLAVAGTAGSVIVATLASEAVEREVPVTAMNIVLDRDGFVWKGHEHLTPKEGALSLSPGFQPHGLLQLHPPAAVTALVLHSEWGVAAAGTAHGLALFDYTRHKGVLTRCTLNPNDLSGSGDAPISRRKSFKKSLRESFRRLRKGRSQRRADNPAAPAAKRGGGGPTSPTSPTAPAAAASATPKAPDSSSPSAASPVNPLEAKPIERSVEARPVDDALGSMVRCLYFAKTFIVSVHATTPTLWAGTNSGTVLVFTVAVPPADKRHTEDVTCQLGKEVQLKHRAPVIAVAIVDGANEALPEDGCEGGHSDRTPAPPHRVIIGSEEQFKIFTLPSLKPFGKFKLTAHEGSRVRRMGLLQFSTPVHRETCLVCLTNLGDCFVLSLPELRRQMNADVIRREDINGISSLTFTSRGEALYLHSSSEIQRVSLSAAVVTVPRCKLELPEGARPAEEVIQVDYTPDEADEREVEGKEVEGKEVEAKEAAPPPVAAEASKEGTEAPQVNGIDHDSKGLHVTFCFKEEDDDDDERKASDSDRRPRENGTSDDVHDLSVSVGDITVDSVKDHLLVNSSSVNSSTINTSSVNSSSVNSSSMTEQLKTVSSEKTEVVTVVKTTVVSSNEMRAVNNTSVAADIATPAAGVQTVQTTHITEISPRRAPLAKMEDDAEN